MTQFCLTSFYIFCCPFQVSLKSNSQQSQLKDMLHYRGMLPSYMSGFPPVGSVAADVFFSFLQWRGIYQISGKMYHITTVYLNKFKDLCFICYNETCLLKESKVLQLVQIFHFVFPNCILTLRVLNTTCGRLKLT